MKKVLIVVGTRPNFIKVTRFKAVAQERGGLQVRLLHTGQHYSANMSDVFFEQFGLVPDVFLNTPPGSPNGQMASIMQALEPALAKEKPNMVLAVGDVNSTLAAALTANKMGIALGHLESGLRSFDRTMPEEHNRVLTDHLADHFFITESSGMENLRREGKAESALHMVGNTMIDTLLACDRQVQENDVLARYGLRPQRHVLMTIHRPATVDVPERLSELLDVVADIAAHHRVVFPVHPRTVKNIEAFGLRPKVDAIPGLLLTEPLDYFAFQKLVATCAFVLTDSGGIQEETTYRRIPCLTLRPNTERPITVTLGTNELLPLEPIAIQQAVARIIAGGHKTGTVPPLWDGHATERVVQVLERVV
jgi:UDP-N-acetylglucosamine 2-epimerase (non-hydrolysing)